ncbi:MAG: hypothetical protein IKM00_05495 [Clostridia bacterium]|nr:hypothetical protein [Clostridia bacterium]
MKDLPIKITGIRYYYDNNIVPSCLFTEEGFRTMTAIEYILNRSSTSVSLSISSDGISRGQGLYGIIPDFDIPADKIYVSDRYYKQLIASGASFTSSFHFNAVYHHFDYYYNDEPMVMHFKRTFGDDSIVIFSEDGSAVRSKDVVMKPSFGNTSSYSPDVLISDELLREIAEEVLEQSYKQASLFFENDAEAHRAAEAMRADGYIAVPSDTEYEPGAEEAIMGVISGLAIALVWFVAILFLAFFINLCSSRALGAFKGDMAIMRSMGIPVQVIRIAMYTRMMLALIPAFLCMVAVAVLIFTSPAMNEFFLYLYAWQYAAIVLGMILLTVMITRKQVRRLFGESVKKSLKGDNAQ